MGEFLLQGLVALLVGAALTYFGYRLGKGQSDKQHREQMDLMREQSEEQKRQWEAEQRDKNSPGLTDWNINP